jgi:hypothetical protein
MGAYGVAPYGAGREWVEALPGARLLTLEGAAHQVWADRPEVLEAIRRFFEGVWPEGAMRLGQRSSNSMTETSLSYSVSAK